MNLSKPTEAELDILQILWEYQPCSVKIIHEQVSQIKEVGYTTTQKHLQRMLEKGLIQREATKGKSFNYLATESAETTKSQLFDRMVKNVFGDSVNELLMHALGKAKASKKDIADIKKFIEKLDKKKK